MSVQSVLFYILCWYGKNFIAKAKTMPTWAGPKTVYIIIIMHTSQVSFSNKVSHKLTGQCQCRASRPAPMLGPAPQCVRAHHFQSTSGVRETPQHKIRGPSAPSTPSTAASPSWTKRANSIEWSSARARREIVNTVERKPGARSNGLCELNVCLVVVVVVAAQTFFSSILLFARSPVRLVFRIWWCASRYRRDARAPCNLYSTRSSELCDVFVRLVRFCIIFYLLCYVFLL